MRKRKIFVVVGARPNYMKAAPLFSALLKYDDIEPSLIHTGQHYDEKMSEIFFKDLALPEPDMYLGVGSGTHGQQTGKVMVEFEKVCLTDHPDLVVVVGDVNSTLACALVATKLHIPVAHIEAGLRSFDRTMPEEINRILTDQISDYLFTTCEDADANLKSEGIAEEKIFFVGNVMIDSLMRFLEKAKESDVLARICPECAGGDKSYALLTLHRPSNVDDQKVLQGIVTALNEIASRIPIIFPIHPRTQKRLESFDLLDKLRITTTPPLGYLDFLSLMADAALVLTDSGGIQEETTILGIPCLTLRENTERPITLKEGTNTIVGSDPEKIVAQAFKALDAGRLNAGVPKLWDGRAAGRIAQILTDKL
jgi:UDP-N-acetylglucosamine 2-epimerase (non-hydrolysing)